MCGDLNLTSDSRLYEFIAKSKFENYKEADLRELSGQFRHSKTGKIIGNTLLPEELGVSDQCQLRPEVEKRRLVENAESCQCTFGSDSLSHNFNFNSVYEHMNRNGTPEVTTCMKDFRGTVDYIFFHLNSKSRLKDQATGLDRQAVETRDESLNRKPAVKREFNSEDNESAESNLCAKLNLLARLKLFNSDLVQNYCLPDKNYPSDHFSLVAKFSLD
jgi:hypothetical protein